VISVPNVTDPSKIVEKFFECWLGCHIGRALHSHEYPILISKNSGLVNINTPFFVVQKLGCWVTGSKYNYSTVHEIPEHRNTGPARLQCNRKRAVFLQYWFFVMVYWIFRHGLGDLNKTSLLTLDISSLEEMYRDLLFAFSNMGHHHAKWYESRGNKVLGFRWLFRSYESPFRGVQTF